MKKNYLYVVLVLLTGTFLSLWTLSCRKNSGEDNTLEPKEWFEAYVESDSSAYNWRQNHVKNINWEKAVEVKDAFDNEAWEIPVESNMFFGYEHTVTKVNGQEVAEADQLKSDIIISPFKVHLLITKNKAGKFDGRILNYFSPGSDSTKQYPKSMNELYEYRDFGISITEFSGKPDYSLYYGANGLLSFSTPSLEISELLKTKLPVTERADRCTLVITTITTDWYQNNSGGGFSTGFIYTNSTSQYHIDYICWPIVDTGYLPPIPSAGTGGGYGGSTVTTGWFNNNFGWLETLPYDTDEEDEQEKCSSCDKTPKTRTLFSDYYIKEVALGGVTISASLELTECRSGSAFGFHFINGTGSLNPNRSSIRVLDRTKIEQNSVCRWVLVTYHFVSYNIDPPLGSQYIGFPTVTRETPISSVTWAF